MTTLVEEPRLRRRPSPYAVVALAGVAWILFTIVRSVPCLANDDQGAAPENFAHLCYSDIPFLYVASGAAVGVGPFSTDRAGIQPMEYPALSWYVASGSAWAVDLLTGPPWNSERRSATPLSGSVADAPGVHTETWWYFTVNVILLALAFAAIALLIGKAGAERRRVGFWLLAPSVLLAGAINWDMLAAASMVGALVAWQQRRPGLAGLAVGVGAALKLFPALALGAFLVLALRDRKLRPFAVCAAVAIGTWALINAPLYVHDPEAWRFFWEFQSRRSADFGSVWQSLRIGGIELSSSFIKVVGYGGFLAGCLGLLVHGLRSAHAPRLANLTFLIVWGFIVSGSVNNAQYALWLLPIALLTRVRLRDVAIWQLGELAFYLGAMLHIGQVTPPDEGADKIYVLTVAIRLLTGAWLALQVLRGLTTPEEAADG